MSKVLKPDDAIKAVYEDKFQLFCRILEFMIKLCPELKNVSFAGNQLQWTTLLLFSGKRNN